MECLANELLVDFIRANVKKEETQHNNEVTNSTCGDHGDGYFAVHGGVYQGSEYDIRIGIHGLVYHLRRRVDLSKCQHKNMH